MKTNILDSLISKSQKLMYNDVQACSKTTRLLLSAPVALADVALETLKNPLRAIENVAFAALNLVGALFDKNCSLKDTLWNVEMACAHTILTPLTVALAPFKFLYQFFEILKDSSKVQSIHTYYHWNRKTDLRFA